jgi:hypothetical protein
MTGTKFEMLDDLLADSESRARSAAGSVQPPKALLLPR